MNYSKEFIVDRIKIINTSVKEIQQVLSERGLTSQVNQSCDDTLRQLSLELNDYVITLSKFESFRDEIRLCSHILETISRINVSFLTHTPLTHIEDMIRQDSLDSVGLVRLNSLKSNDDNSRSMEVSPISKFQTNSSIYSWGREDLGALSKANMVAAKEMKSVDFARDIMQISSNFYHTAVVTTTGELYTCGSNDEGQVNSNRDIKIFPRFKLLENLLSHRVCYVSCGLHHTSCVNSNGIAFTFGSNEFGQLGHPRNASNRIGSSSMDTNSLQPITIKNTLIMKVICSDYVTFLLDCKGAVYSCGLNDCNGHIENDIVDTPKRIASLARGIFVKDLCAGSSHAIALSATGELYVWGNNSSYQLGIKDMPPGIDSRAIVVPTLINFSSFVTGFDQDTSLLDINHQIAPSRIIIQGISSGQKHSLVWTEDGILYGCGSNKHCQLGGAQMPLVVKTFSRIALSSSDGLGSALVVKQVACGLNHTLVLCHYPLSLSTDTYSKSISPTTYLFSFGMNNYKQCDIASDAMVCSSPSILDAFLETDVVLIAAGGDHSFAVTISPSTSDDSHPEGHQLTREFSRMISHQVNLQACDTSSILRLLNSHRDESADDLMISSVHLSKVLALLVDLFSNPTSLGGSFLHTAMPMSLDILGLDTCYDTIVNMSGNSDAVAKALASAFQACLSTMESTSDMNDSNIMSTIRVILIIWQCNVLSLIRNTAASSDIPRYGFYPELTPGTCTMLVDVMSRIGNIIVGWKKEYQSLLVRMMYQYPSNILSQKLVHTVQLHLSYHMSVNSGTGRYVPLYCFLLKLVYSGNENNSNSLPITAFYNDAIQSGVVPLISLFRDYVSYCAFMRQRDKQLGMSGRSDDKDMPFFLTHYAFLYPIEVKKNLVIAESQTNQQNAQQTTYLLGFLNRSPSVVPFLILIVNRKNLLQSSISQLQALQDADFKKPLKVIFEGEEGVDEGGVRKEFFQLIVRQLFDAQFGMFVSVNNNTTLWFNKDCTWSSTLEYNLIGIIFGLAVYNNIQLDVLFCKVLYKKMLNYKLTLKDVYDVDVELYKGLKYLLAYEPKEDIPYVFCRTFEVTWFDQLAIAHRYELIADGANIEVIADNRVEYVSKYVDWLLVDSVGQQFGEFMRGFNRVIGSSNGNGNGNEQSISIESNKSVINIFHPDELELLICGSSELNFFELERTTTYISGQEGDNWNRSHPTIVFLWEVLHEFDLIQKQKFLFFFTGSIKAPLGGLSEVCMKIQRMGSDVSQLPTCHTCFNTILLPEYRDRETLKRNLLVAINETEGFGLR